MSEAAAPACTPHDSFTAIRFDHARLVASNLGGQGGVGATGQSAGGDGGGGGGGRSGLRGEPDAAGGVEVLPVLCRSPVWGVAAAVLGVVRLSLAVGAFFCPLFTVVGLSALSPSLQATVDRLNITILLPNTWSLADGIGMMAVSPSPYQRFFSVDMGLFLLGMPLASATLAIYCVLKPIGRVPTAALRLMHGLTRFSNLEVFLLALLVYLAEMDHFILLRTHEAFYCLCAYVPVLVASLVCTSQAVRQAEGRR